MWECFSRNKVLRDLCSMLVVLCTGAFSLLYSVEVYAEPPEYQITAPQRGVNTENLILRRPGVDGIVLRRKVPSFELRVPRLALVDSWRTAYQAYAIDINEQGAVYVSDIINHIAKYKETGNLLREWDIPYSGTLGIRGLTLDRRVPNGNIYVATYFTSKVFVLDRNGAVVNFWPAMIGQQQFVPHGFAVLENGNLLISDDTNGCLREFTPTGVFVKTVGYPGQMKQPRQLAYDKRNGDIYVADRNNHRIVVLGIDGVERRSWGSNGTGDGQFDTPHGIALDPSRNLVFVGDTMNDRIQVFDTQGNYLLQRKVVDFQEPRYMAVQPDGDLLVTSAPDFKIGVFQFVDH